MTFWRRCATWEAKAKVGIKAKSEASHSLACLGHQRLLGIGYLVIMLNEYVSYSLFMLPTMRRRDSVDESNSRDSWLYPMVTMFGYDLERVQVILSTGNNPWICLKEELVFTSNWGWEKEATYLHRGRSLPCLSHLAHGQDTVNHTCKVDEMAFYKPKPKQDACVLDQSKVDTGHLLRALTKVRRPHRPPTQTTWLNDLSVVLNHTKNRSRLSFLHAPKISLLPEYGFDRASWNHLQTSTKCARRSRPSTTAVAIPSTKTPATATSSGVCHRLTRPSM